MGYYINPPDMSKEQFLDQNGRVIKRDEVMNFDFNSNELPVCLVDNGWMPAAVIAYNERERDAFADPDDRRPKFWYAVSVDLLKPYL